ncbi:MAG: hypothetical protein Q4F00_11380 [bacterium]|nr:hypothetical protein [bacterium]
MKMNKNWLSLLSSCGIAALAFMQSAWAQNPQTDNLPNPLPTNAAAARTKSLEAYGTAPVEAQSCDEQATQIQYAHTAASLDALFDLCLQAHPPFSAQKTALIDDIHDPALMLGWLSQAKILREHRSSKKNIYIKASSQSWNLFKEKPPQGKLMFHADIDGDKIPDKFILGPDSCISVVSQGRTLGKTDCIGSFHGRTIGQGSSSIRHIDYTEVLKVTDVKRLSEERINIIVKLRVSEALGNRLVGQYDYLREFPLDVAASHNAPSVVIEIPRSQRVDKLKNVPLLGIVEAPEGIAKANLLLNGKEVWNIPEGLQLRKLTLDLSLELQPGPNELWVNVWDNAGKSFTKKVRFMAPPSTSVTSNRALLIGTDSVGIQSVSKAREQLLQRNYIVKTLRGEEANLEAITAAMDTICQSCQPGDRVLVYFAGAADWADKERVFLTSGSEANGSGNLRPLHDQDWIRWQNELSPYRVCYIFDTVATPELQRHARGKIQDMRLIRDLSGLRNLVLTSGNPDQRLGTPSKLNDTLIEFWKNSPKKDIYDLNVQAYERLCIQNEVLPLLTGY